MKNIGSTIKLYRKKRGIQQNELASKIGISQTYLSQIENGVKVATIEVLEKISIGLDIPLPILSFLSLDPKDLKPEKRNDYYEIEQTLNPIIEKLFL